MEKSKNRTDLLAAGKKKLQQFRQKKDNKGTTTTTSSTQRKSTSRNSKFGSTVGAPSQHLGDDPEMPPEPEAISVSDKDVALDDTPPLPVVASLVTLATGEGDTGPVADDDPVPDDLPSPSNSPSQATRASSDDTPTLSIEAVQGNNLNTTDQQTESNESEYGVPQVGDSSLLPCRTPGGVQQVDELHNSIQEVQNMELDTCVISFSSDYNNHIKEIRAFPLINLTPGTCEGMDEVDVQSIEVIDQMLDGGRSKETDVYHTTKHCGDKEVEIFLVPSDSLQPNRTCETSGALHGFKGVVTDECESNPNSSSLQPNNMCETSGVPRDFKDVVTDECENNPSYSSVQLNSTCETSGASHDFKSVVTDEWENSPTSSSLQPNNTCEISGTLHDLKGVVTDECEYNPRVTSELVDYDANKEVNSHETSVGFENKIELENERGTQVSFGKTCLHIYETPQKSSESSFSAGYNTRHIVPSSNCTIEDIDNLKKQLYLTNIMKDFLNMHLHEDIMVKVERDVHLSQEVVRLHDLLEDHLMIQKELAVCNVQLQAANTKTEELETDLASAKGEVKALNNKENILQIQLEKFQQQSSVFSMEFTKCKDSLETLQIENLKLKEDLTLQTDKGKKLEVEKEHLVHENRILSSKLLDQSAQLVLALDKQTELESDVKESNIYIDKLAKENLSLSVSLNTLKYKFKELSEWRQTLYQSQESEEQAEGHKIKNLICDGAATDTISMQKKSEEIHLHNIKDNHNERTIEQALDKDYVNAVTFNTLKIHMDEFETLIDQIEETIDGLHSDVVEAHRSGSKVAASGVSKLIHAFETKSNIYEASSALLPIPGGSAINSLDLTKKQIVDLRIAFQQLHIELKEAVLLLRITPESLSSVQQVEENYPIKNLGKSDFEVKYNDLVNKLSDYKLLVDNLQNQIESISRNSVEEMERFLNIMEMLQDKVNTGLTLYNPMINGLQTQIGDIFQNANDEGAKFLKRVEVLEEEVYNNAYIHKPLIVQLQNQIEDITKNAAEETRGYLNKIDVLQKEVDSCSSVLENERKLTRDFLSAAFQKLDASTGMLVLNDLDYSSHISASVDASVKVIDDLSEKLEALSLELDTKHYSYAELHQKHLKMQEKNVFAVEILHSIINELREIIGDSCLSETKDVTTENVDDLLETFQGDSVGLIKHLKNLVDERMSLLSTKREFELLLMDRNLEIEEINSRCSALSKKLEDLRDISISIDFYEEDTCFTPLLHLEALVASLLQRYNEASEQIRLSSKYLRGMTFSQELLSDTSSMSLPDLLNQHIVPKMIESVELQEKVKKMTSVILQKENEIKVIKESLCKTEEALEMSKSDLHVKVVELQESEQRLYSVREKLSIAVTKGKGLIVQRNDLNQSLLEKSGELEKCLQDLQAKEEMLREVKAKLKSYSEADRVEALESELSYIRNSATAFRDSFLLKDSILQRIEEVLEDMDLPENVHNKDVVEKIELLARSVTGKSTSIFTKDGQNDSFGKPYYDTRYGMNEACKEATQQTPSIELHDLRSEYADLQNKYYSLAEQNDMLEQSLLKRNKVVQWWEEAVDKIEMPPNSRSVEAEVKMEWLISTFSDMRRERDCLLLKTNELAESKDSLTLVVQELQEKISELSSEFATLKYEREFLAESLDTLRHETLEFSEKAVQDELDKDHLHNEIAHLNEKHVGDFSNEIKKLEDIILDVMPDADDEDTSPDDQHTVYLERLLVKLVERYKILNLENPTDPWSTEFLKHKSIVTPDEVNIKALQDEEDRKILFLKEQLDEITHNLVISREETDAISKDLHSLILENMAITKQKDVLLEERDAEIEKSKSLLLQLDSLDEQLSQEKQISASVREKLNVAVRKGKGLVQQRDSLKQTIVEQNEELQRLQNEHNQSASEILSLHDELTKVKHDLMESELTLNDLFVALNSFDFGEEITPTTPIQKLKGIIKFGSDWHALAISYDHEAKKAKRSSELLLAELNEVQERTDVLQEDLLKAECAFTECSRQRGELEASRDASLSQFDQFRSFCSEERDKRLADIMQLKSDIYKLRNQCISFSHMLSNFFYEDEKCFRNIVGNSESILNFINGTAHNIDTDSGSIQFSDFSYEEMSLSTSTGINILGPFDDESAREDISLAGIVMHECVEELGDLKEKLRKHSLDIQQQVKSFSVIVEHIEKKVVSERLSSESLRKELIDVEMVKNDKETEVISLRRNVAALYETCRRLFFEIESRKAAKEDLGSVVLSHGRMEAVSILQAYDGETSGGLNVSLTVKDIKAIEEILLSNVESLVRLEEQVLKNDKELKNTISGLQHELQERDIQKNRICSELVSQIQDAEATAKKYWLELDSAKNEIRQLEGKTVLLENNKEMLELKLKESFNSEVQSKDLQDKIRHLTDSLHLKDQEIEGLMQALDEEESQLENLESRSRGLEEILQEKSLTLKSLEVSSAKAVAKLSITMNKFDELHCLSESLLAEVENLQSQLEDRDYEISFLQQEVTRYSKHASVEQEKSSKNFTEAHQLHKFVSMIVSRFGIHNYNQSLEEQTSLILARLDELEADLLKKDVSLRDERSRTEEYLRKIRSLEISLRENESQVELFQQDRDYGQPSISSSNELVEIENVRKKGANLSSVAPLVRSGRKVNSEYVSVGIDLEQDDAIEEDDDKAHGFKALTMSRMIPKATRPVADKIDGLWVSIERLLMRQPSLRIGLIIYWVALHAMLAASI